MHFTTSVFNLLVPKKSHRLFLSFNYRIRVNLLDVFNINSVSFQKYTHWNKVSLSWIDSRLKKPLSFSKTSINKNYDYRPFQIWSSGISKFSLIRSRRFFLAYFNFFYMYQTRISKFIMTLYSLFFEDLFIFSNFNIVKILKSLGFSIDTVVIAVLQYRTVVFCNGFRISSINFVCSLFDFITFSPLFIYFAGIFSFSTYFNSNLVYFQAKNLYDMFLENKRPITSYSVTKKKTHKFKSTFLPFLEVDWRSLSLIILTMRLNPVHRTAFTSLILRVPSLNFRSLNWKYLN